MEQQVVCTCPKLKCERHGKYTECREHHSPKPPVANGKQKRGKDAAVDLRSGEVREAHDHCLLYFRFSTNYREIVKRNPEHDYLVFTNRPAAPVSPSPGQTTTKSSNSVIRYISEMPASATAPGKCRGIVRKECSMSKKLRAALRINWEGNRI